MGERQMGIIGHNGKLVLPPKNKLAFCWLRCVLYILEKKKKRKCGKALESGDRFFEPDAHQIRGDPT